MPEIKEAKLQDEGLEISFSEIYRLLKKGAVLLTICLIVGVILTTSILLVMREFIGTTSYETEITFSSASITDNDEYNPSINVNTLIKSSTIVSKALTNLGYPEESINNLIGKGLIENLSAYAKESKTDNDGVSYPYVVVLSLKKLGNRNLSKAQSAALIEEITKQVVLELQSQYRKDVSFGKLDTVDYSKYNYLQAYAKLRGALDNVDVFANGLGDNMLNYSKNGVSVKSILSKFEVIESEINVIKLRLTNNALVNATASSSEFVYATDKASIYSQKATTLATRISEYATLLKDTKPDITVMTGTVTIEALKSYYELVDIYNELQNEYAQVLAKAQEWEEIKTAYSGATTPDTIIQSQINDVVSAYNAAYDSLNSIVESYNTDSYTTNLVIETSNVSTIKDSAISPLVIVLVDVVAIAVIMVVVFALEKIKENKQAKKAKE